MKKWGALCAMGMIAVWPAKGKKNIMLKKSKE